MEYFEAEKCLIGHLPLAVINHVILPYCDLTSALNRILDDSDESVELVKWLLSKGAKGAPAVSTAIRKNLGRIVPLLADTDYIHGSITWQSNIPGIDFLHSNNAAISFAAHSGQYQMVRFLVSKGALTHPNQARHNALTAGHNTIVMYLDSLI